MRGRAANALTGAAKAMQWWCLFVVAVYLIVGALLGGRVGQPSSFFQAILITVLWTLLWPFMLLFMQALGIIWPEAPLSVRHVELGMKAVGLLQTGIFERVNCLGRCSVVVRAGLLPQRRMQER